MRRQDPLAAGISIDAGVIDDARARQWRRRAGLVATLAAASAAVALTLASLGSGTPRASTNGATDTGTATRIIPTLPAARVLARQPYMGLSCTSPQAVECDRVTLGVWLRARAVSATALFDGRRLLLDSRRLSDPPVKGKHLFVAGFLQPGPFLRKPPFSTLIAKMGGEGWHAPVTVVHLVVNYGRGHEVQTTTSVAGLGGWG
jgi:hypothetical protein